jgi:antitoxin (DNA-binding transcriptional repressor) of toxin-antitoxin stability system
MEVVDEVHRPSHAPRMAETVNVQEAKTHLSRLLAREETGGRVVIARTGHPVAELTPISHERPPRVPGHDRVVIHDNFDHPLPELKSACEVRVLLDTPAVRQSPAVFRRPQQEGIPMVTSDHSIARYEIEVIR